MKITLYLFLTLYAINAFGQYEILTQFLQPEYENKRTELFEKSEFIFEGNLKEEKVFFISDSTMYTSFIIDITRVFKGKLETGTVEIIQKGGRLEIFDSIGTVLSVIDRRVDEEFISYSYSNRKRIYFCSEFKGVMSIASKNITNQIKLTPSVFDVRSVISYGRLSEIFAWGAYGIKFHSEQEIQDYLKGFKGVKIPKPSQPKLLVEPKIVSISIPDSIRKKQNDKLFEHLEYLKSGKIQMKKRTASKDSINQ